MKVAAFIAMTALLVGFCFVENAIAITIFDNLPAAVAESKRLVAQKKFAEARDVLLTVSLYVSKKDRPELLAARGWVEESAGNVLDALKYFNDAIEASGPGEPCSRLARAEFFESVGENGAAIADVDYAIASGCKTRELNELAGRLSVATGDYDGAIKKLSAPETTGALSEDSIKALGSAYIFTGDPRSAAAMYKKAAALDPTSSVLENMIADAMFSYGDFDGAMPHYEKSVELDPANTIALNNKGYSLYIKGKPDEALEIFKKLNNKTPTIYSLCNEMEIHLHFERYDEALEAGRKCLEAFSKNQNMQEYERYYLGAVVLALRLIHEDREQLHPLTLYELGKQYEESGQYIDAQSYTLASLMLDPGNADSVFEAGKIYFILGDTVKAASFLNISLSLGGDGFVHRNDALELIEQLKNE